MSEPSPSLGVQGELANLETSLESSLVTALRATPVGQKLEKEYTQQVIADYVNKYWWVGAIVVLILLLRG